MTFKQFKLWCGDRVCDGRWSFDDAKFCVDLLDDMNQIPWWRRKRTWKKIENKVVFAVVTPTNKKFKRQLVQRWMGAKMVDNTKEIELWRLVNAAILKSIENFGDVFAKDVTRDLISGGVEIPVRCKDCKYYRESQHPERAGIKFCYRLKERNGEHIGYNYSGNDFCSYGERREGE